MFKSLVMDKCERVQERSRESSVAGKLFYGGGGTRGFSFFFFFLALPGLWAEVGQTRLVVFFYSLLTSFECVCLSGLVAGIEKGRGSFLFFSFSFLAPLWGGGGGGKGRGKPVGYRRWGWLHPGGRGKKGSLLYFFIITLLLPVLLQHRYSFHKKNIFSREKNSRSQPNN